MEKFLYFIQRMRSYPEPVRRRFFLLSVGGCILVIGALWLTTLPWQLQNAREVNAVENERVQPTLSETFGQGGAAISDMARGALRNWILGEAPQENAQHELEEEEAVTPESQEVLPRLPRAE